MEGTDRKRWLILVAVSVAQLMVVLDATITSVALPSAQRALGFGADTRQWVVTAYALSFGSLLLVGGRLGDQFGRKRTFVAGLLGFAGASALGGAATSFGMLVGARAAQGAFAALLAPSALGLLATTFVEPVERFVGRLIVPEFWPPQPGPSGSSTGSPTLRLTAGPA